MRYLRGVLIGLSIALAGGFGLGFAYSYPPLMIAAAFKAQLLCIGVFEGGRTPEHVLSQELSEFGYLSGDVDMQEGRTEASFLGLMGRSAQFQPGWGCRLPFGLEAPLPEVAPVQGDDDLDLMRSDNADLVEAVEAWFEPDLKTHAVLVADASGVLHEAYAQGVAPDSALIGWSMSKSVVHALVGRLVQQGLLSSLDEPLPQPLWHHHPDDPRAAITWEHLLRMGSGLEWDEDYGTLSDATRMLLAARSVEQIPAAKPLVHPVGTHWQYSSGTSNLLSAAAASLVPDDLQPMRTLLFEPLGMQTAYAGTDARGNIVGSSYLAASARDWAKFGRLYLQDGVWQGERLLPEGWAAHAASEAALDQSGEDVGRYGAHWWRNPERGDDGAYYPGLPVDAFSAEGFDGQFLFVIPSRGLVLLRLGARAPERELLAERMAAILDALEG
ncbi:MAG: serine hydrolase [Gammaproteobacteria bacterium AqS3]|nr:serine hydrolase [Gammaproteobacteria bacterium AqS3]